MRSAFTLVELMIVVAIVAVLAAIAVPNFYEMQLKAKRGEVPTNVDGLFNAAVAYHATHDAYPDVSYLPAGDPGKTPRVWTSNAEFDALGWRPDGDVRGQYYMQSRYTTFATCNSVFYFTCPGLCAGGRVDLDGDGVMNCAGIYEPVRELQWIGGLDTY